MRKEYQMIYPKTDCIVEIRRAGWNHWSTALFYWNGRRPIFAQYGSEVDDVIEWRKKIPQRMTH